MKILKEGTISILPDGQYVASDFHVDLGDDIQAFNREIYRRIRLAASLLPTIYGNTISGDVSRGIIIGSNNV